MKKRIAQLLRRTAQRIDPQPVQKPWTYITPSTSGTTYTLNVRP